MGDAVSEYLARFRALGLDGSPLSLAQVAALEGKLGLSLPAAYRAYLLLAGAGPPPELVGSDCHGDYLPYLRGWADELLAECGHPFELPDDAVVFLMHQRYQFFYFRADGRTADPPVFYFMEGMAAPEQWGGRFSEWVDACVSR